MPIIDSDQLMLREFMCDGVWEAALDEWTSAERAAFTEAQLHHGSPQLPTDWRHALPILDRVHSVLLDRLRALSTRFSPAAWLWYLRRVRLPRDATRAGTWPYARLGAEAVTVASKSAPSEFVFDKNLGLRCEVNLEAAESVAQLMVGARFVRSCEATRRRICKGAMLHADEFGLPEAPGDAEFEALLLAFDQRCERDGEFASPSGTLATGREDDDSHRFVVVGAVPIPEFLPIPAHPQWSQQVPGELLVEYSPNFIRDTFLRELLATRQVSFDQEVAPQFLALYQLLSCAAAMLALAPHYALSTLRNGYLVLSDPATHLLKSDALNWSATHAKALGIGDGFTTPHSLLARLETLAIDGWPDALGPPLRQLSKGVIVDLVAATHHLHRMLARFGRTGRDGQERGEHFELAVQEVIDTTRWRPAGPLRELRGRELVVEGTALTDIDAIACDGTRLLIVSCKSVQRTAAYERGEFNAIRNAEVVVDEAVRYWNGIAATLRASPVGGNFDLSAYSELIPVVVTPWPVWVGRGPALSESAPGLPACVSASELQRWLTTERITP